MFSRLITAFVVALIAAIPTLAFGDDWRPIDLADPALKSPLVEKDADAEAIFWEVYLDDSASEGLAFSNYLRVKVFTEHGRELESKIDLAYASGWKIQDISARTIKPDGSIVELKNEDVFDRTIVKLGGAKIKAKTFAVPGVEVGSIVEYRWREILPGRIAYYVRLPFQREIPIRSVTYHFRPSNRVIGKMRLGYFNMPEVGLEVEPNNFYRSTMTNVPAFHEEPSMSPEDAVRPWMLVYYVRVGDQLNRATYWQDLGKRVYEIYKPKMKVGDDVRRAASEAVGDATLPEEKLRRIFDYCRAKIKNASSLGSEMTSEEREDRKDNKSPSDTLKHGEGSGTEINLLFGAMAGAAGFEARVALMPNRGDDFFDKNFPNPYFLTAMSIAVKVGDKWCFLDPGASYVPWDMLPWPYEWQSALVSDPDQPSFQPIPLSPPEKSGETRMATLRLTADGRIEGDARVDYTGHLAVTMKRRHEADSPLQREQSLRDEIKQRMSTADVSDVHIENATEPVKPFVCRYHANVPEYASRTGKRIFLPMAFFQHGLKPLFSSSRRKYDIYFHYPWSESDEVRIELPDGYSVESLSPPATADFGPYGSYRSSTEIANNGRVIIHRRSFVFGLNGTLLFAVGHYAGLKDYFDTLHQLDNHTVTIAQTTASK